MTEWLLFETGEVERSEAARQRLAARPHRVRRGHQAERPEIAVRADRAFLGELGDKGTDRRDRPGMGILHVDVERPGPWIFEAGDRLVGWDDAVDGDALEARGILLEEAVAEDPERAGVCLKLLDDEI